MDRKLSRAKLLLRDILALMLLFAPLASHAYAPSDKPNTLRVGLVRYFNRVKRIAVSASADFRITDDSTDNRIASSTAAAPIALEAGESAIVLRRTNGDSARVGVCLTVIASDPGATISICGGEREPREYRGTVEVSLASGTLRLVNVVDVEDYLLGVVPSEMPSSYPDEALKAQAVAARTYALANIGKHASLGYDLCDTGYCQVYEGALAETPACTRAVAATRGVVLTYSGQPASVQYCADCGGVTRSYSEARPGSNIPYLCGVKEPPEIAHSDWEKVYTVQEIARKLVKAGIKEADGLETLALTASDSSGRAQWVRLTGRAGKAAITGEKLRSALGGDMPSTLIQVDSSADGVVTIRGKGRGHGIGMCQVGARALAGAPFAYTFDRILAHYFPGTTLSVPANAVARGKSE